MLTAVNDVPQENAKQASVHPPELRDMVISQLVRKLVEADTCKITVIDSLLRANCRSDVVFGGGDPTYHVLWALNSVEFKDMDRELLEKLPTAISHVTGLPAELFSAIAERKTEAVQQPPHSTQTPARTSGAFLMGKMMLRPLILVLGSVLAISFCVALVASLPEKVFGKRDEADGARPISLLPREGLNRAVVPMMPPVAPSTLQESMMKDPYFKLDVLTDDPKKAVLDALKSAPSQPAGRKSSVSISLTEFDTP